MKRDKALMVYIDQKLHNDIAKWSNRSGSSMSAYVATVMKIWQIQVVNEQKDPDINNHFPYVRVISKSDPNDSAQ